MSSALARLFKPRSVAVIGASTDASKTAGKPIAYLRKHGFSGDIYPVNPRVDQIDGLRCYSDIAALPAVPDVAIVLLGVDRALQAVRQLAALGTPVAIVLASGYAETGEAGALRQQQLQEAAGPMRLLGPNTIGLVNLTDQIVLSPSGALDMAHFTQGCISVVSQSGGILGSLLSRAAARGIGLAKLVSTSNEADIDLADCIDYLSDDPATRVMVLYVETVRHPARFRAACLKAVQAGKPVVAFKIGRSEAGALAAASHTGALAGADRMYDALFQSVGVVRANTFSDLLDIPLALSTGRSLHGKRVAILTSTGGAGTLVSDSLGVAGFSTPAPDAATAARLMALQPSAQAAMDRNPIDVTLAGLQPEVLRGAIQALLDSPSYDALVIIVGSSGVAQPQLMGDAIAACLASSAKPVLAYVSPHAPEAAALLSRMGVAAFSAPESCAVALLGLWHAAQTLAAAHSLEPSLAGLSDIHAPHSPPPAAPPNLPTGSLDEAQAKQLFASYGIPCVRELVACTPDQAEQAAHTLASASQPRVVLKLLSSQITHKSEVGGVAVNLLPDQVGPRLQAMRTQVAAHTGSAPERFVVQSMVSGGTELILGMHRDPLGTAILLGMGGITAELFKDTVLRMLPAQGGLSARTALDMAQSLTAWPLLDGFRGAAKADVAALCEAIVAFSNMVASLGDRLVEAEINPLFVLPAGQGVCAADGVAVLR